MINGRIITTMPAVKQQATLYFLEKGTNQFELSLADDNGVIRSLSGVSGGTGTAAAQTLSEVLTTGNKLEGKEIEGDLVVKNVYTNGVNTTGGYRISGNNEGIELSGSGEGYSSILKVGGSWNAVRGDFYYPVNTGTSSGYWQVGAKGIELYSEVLDHSLGIQFRATDRELFYNRYEDGKPPLAFCVQDSGIHSQFPDVELGGDNYITFYINSTNGIFLSKYIKPTRDEEYTQKKYVDDKLAGLSTGGGEKIDITVDRMYLTYAGKLAVDITINGLPGNKVPDSNLFDHSTFRMEVANGTSHTRAFFTFGPTGNATIEKTYMYVDTGTVKAHIEAVLPSMAVDSWGVPNPGKDIFNKTRGFFVYVPEAGMNFNQGVRSRMTHYGEVYDKRQSGVVNFKLQDGKQSTLIPSTEEYKFFAFDADTFKAEDPIDSTYSYLINNGIPIGSQDVQSGYILSDNRIMPNPAPNQVTDWDLTFKVSGKNSTVLPSSNEHLAVVYDAENNIVDEALLNVVLNAAGEVISVRAKLTTINKFKNIVGDKRGFKFGIKVTSNYNTDIDFELVNIKRTSRALY